MLSRQSVQRDVRTDTGARDDIGGVYLGACVSSVQLIPSLKKNIDLLAPYCSRSLPL